MRLWTRLFFVVIAFRGAPTVVGGTVVEVTGPSGDFAIVSNFPDAVSWTSSVGYNDLNISAELFDFGGAVTADAYLTTALGFDTTVASQIAETEFSINTNGLIPIFSGLNLTPGTYYLTLANFSGEVGWVDSTSDTTTLGVGVSDVSNWTSGGGSGYPPGFFWDPWLNGGFQFDVSGTTAPEPASSTLAILGIAVAILKARKRATKVGADR